MLFTPITQIMVADAQRRHLAAGRLDGPTTVSKQRRRGFFTGVRSATNRQTTSGRTLATA